MFGNSSVDEEVESPEFIPSFRSTVLPTEDHVSPHRRATPEHQMNGLLFITETLEPMISSIANEIEDLVEEIEAKKILKAKYERVVAAAKE